MQRPQDFQDKVRHGQCQYLSQQPAEAGHASSRTRRGPAVEPQSPAPGWPPAPGRAPCCRGRRPCYAARRVACRRGSHCRCALTLHRGRLPDPGGRRLCRPCRLCRCPCLWHPCCCPCAGSCGCHGRRGRGRPPWSGGRTALRSGSHGAGCWVALPPHWRCGSGRRWPGRHPSPTTPHSQLMRPVGLTLR